jgi:predicted GIY-YIG superfamily endonuclease
MIGVYHLKLDDEIVYVGQSVDIEKRIKTHTSEGLKQFNGYEVFECSLEELEQLEKNDIQIIRPKHNKRDNPSNPTITALAEHIGMTRQGIQKMKRDHPKKFNILWTGWIAYCEKVKGE